MGIEVTLEGHPRVDIPIADPNGEVEFHPAVMRSDRADDDPATHLLPGRHGSLRQVRVRRPHASVVDGDRAIPNHHTTERDRAVPGRVNGRACPKGDIDAPVAAVAAGREEFADNRTVGGPAETHARCRAK